MFLKILRMTVAVCSLIVASAVPGSAQATVFVNGNTSFTVTWSSAQTTPGLLATAKFTVTNFSSTSFVMTVTNVANTMPTSPDINARLTAFGFGLTPDANFSSLVGGTVYQWALTNFPGFQKVDVCLTSGGGCAGGGNGGLNQGQATNEGYSITIVGDFSKGATITPLPAKFQTGLGSVETDGVVISPPPAGPSDLTIAKVHTPNIAAPGGTVTYTVTVSNVGASPSSGTVTVTETPPPGLTVTALAGTGWACIVATKICTRSDALAPGASYSPIMVTTTVGASVTAGTAANIAVVSGGGEQNTSNNTASDPTVIAIPASGVDLAIAKRHSPGTIVPGETITYSVTVANVGGSPSSGAVTVTETPPTGLTVTALTGAGWTCTITTCTRSDALAPATSYPDITVTASVGASVVPGTVTNTAAVSGGGDANAANNTATDPTTITAPASASDLTIAKVHSPSSAVPGQTITYTVTVGNVGASPSSGQVNVTETPPTGLTITGLSGSGWTCIVATTTCIRTDALAPAMSYPGITVTASVDPGVAPGRLTNIVIVSGGGDSNPTNNTASDPATITAPVSGTDLAIAKTGSPSLAAPGQTVTYTLTVQNVGNSASSGTVTVTETPPTGLTITAISGTGWTCTVQTRTCTRSDALAPATSYPVITVTTIVGASVAPGTLTNSAIVTGGGDSTPGNSTVSDPITIGPSPVPVLPVGFMIGLLSALLALALSALRGRFVSLGRKDTHMS